MSEDKADKARENHEKRVGYWHYWMNRLARPGSNITERAIELLIVLEAKADERDRLSASMATLEAELDQLARGES